MSSQSHEEIIRSAAALWNEHDNRYFDSYSEDLKSHGYPPNIEPNLVGLQRLFNKMWVSLPDSRVEILRLVADGDLAAYNLLITGTHEGELMGGEPTGNFLEIDAMIFCHFRPDGKMDERWTRVDEVKLRLQLGILDPEAVRRK
jgi:predicted ester cyclase